ncbi:hypothetical protein SMICM304S_01860 [Streptomyces microflavus]
MGGRPGSHPYPSVERDHASEPHSLQPYRRKAGLPEMPGAATLMQGAYLTAGFTRFLPEGWINAETIIETLSLSPDSDDPRARTMTALRARMSGGRP